MFRDRGNRTPPPATAAAAPPSPGEARDKSPTKRETHDWDMSIRSTASLSDLDGNSFDLGDLAGARASAVTIGAMRRSEDMGSLSEEEDADQENNENRARLSDLSTTSRGPPKLSQSIGGSGNGTLKRARSMDVRYEPFMSRLIQRPEPVRKVRRSRSVFQVRFSEDISTMTIPARDLDPAAKRRLWHEATLYMKNMEELHEEQIRAMAKRRHSFPYRRSTTSGSVDSGDIDAQSDGSGGVPTLDPMDGSSSDDMDESDGEEEMVVTIEESDMLIVETVSL